MKKIILQGLIAIFLFFGTWFVFSQINWINIFNLEFNIEEKTDKTEEKLGEIFWEFFKNSEKEIKNVTVIQSINSIVTHTCKSNQINRNKLKIHILHNNEINAFALPDGHLVIYSGLIQDCDNQEELVGIISHEIAHIELNHVMKKLTREIGLSVLLSITIGNGGGDFIKNSAKTLSSLAFDRNLEKEADIKAVDYLIKSNINPKPFANFLYRFSYNEHNKVLKYLTWISTHPDPQKRAKYIIEYINSKEKPTDYGVILSNDAWEKLKEALQEI